MQELIKTLMEKLTANNIFHVLLPGAAFSCLLPKLTHFSLLSADVTWLEQFFIWYFVGMIIGRVGSLFVSPLLRKIGYVLFSDYNDYIAATEAKPIIASLSETGKLYRTLIALFLSLAVMMLYDILFFPTAAVSVSDSIRRFLLLGAITVLFIKSYKKQSKYINLRIAQYKESTRSPRLKLQYKQPSRK